MLLKSNPYELVLLGGGGTMETPLHCRSASSSWTRFSRVEAHLNNGLNSAVSRIATPMGWGCQFQKRTRLLSRLQSSRSDFRFVAIVASMWFTCWPLSTTRLASECVDTACSTLYRTYSAAEKYKFWSGVTRITGGGE